VKYSFKWLQFIIGLLVAIFATPILLTSIVKEFICWKEPIVGSISAIVVVSYCYLKAPNYKLICSAFSFLLGAVIAYFAPYMLTYPECHKLAYQSTYIPLMFTYLSGLIVLIFCLYISKNK